MLNKGLKLVKLHMGHLIGPKIAAWYDFCHTKNLKFVPPPIIRCGEIEDPLLKITFLELNRTSRQTCQCTTFPDWKCTRSNYNVTQIMRILLRAEMGYPMGYRKSLVAVSHEFHKFNNNQGRGCITVSLSKPFHPLLWYCTYTYSEMSVVVNCQWTLWW